MNPEGMMITRALCCFLVLCLAAGPAPLLAQSYGEHLQTRLPTAMQARLKGGLHALLDAYTLEKYRLSCDLPKGGRVGIVLVNDQDSFSFLAVRINDVPAIFANERSIPGRDPAYTVFSFYRECGIHAVQDVTATGPADSDSYDAAVVKDAECLAVGPTQVALGAGTEFSFERIASQLRDEYGGQAVSSAAMLRRCSRQGAVDTMSKRLLDTRVKRK
ncbi:hypothetical protein SAMN05880566_11823 [Janthinobacterium sp. TND4EL3]|nr:hypothetical protein SAMN05880566_11823 [Janthinobacterium sp. TND4EL3]